MTSIHRSSCIKLGAIALIALGASTYYKRSQDQTHHESHSENPSGFIPSTSATSTSGPLPVVVAAPTQVRLPNPTSKQTSAICPDQFRHITTQVIGEIPTVAELQSLTYQEAHFTPKRLIQAGFELGKIAQILKDNPKLKAEGISFYQTCAYTHDFPNSVRALCFADLRELDTHHSHYNPADPHVPEDIRSLSHQL